MKRLLCILISLFCNKAMGMQTTETEALTLENRMLSRSTTNGPLITYLSAIPRLLTDESFKSCTEEAKASQFQKLVANFSLGKACDRINKLTTSADNPQVILWLTNYFGKVTKNTLKWYKENIVTQIPKATFWLTDLSAWCFLVAGPNELKGTLVPRLMAKEQLSPAECPLLSQSSLFAGTANSIQANVKLLRSQSFFAWLLKTNNMALITDETCNKLCRDALRDDVLPCSLGAMGFRPKLLDRTVDRYKDRVAEFGTANLLDVPSSLIYPILQYLEGIYYATMIIEANMQKIEAGTNLSVVFLLPNKEFTFFAVPDEIECFQCFQEGVQRAVVLSGNPSRGKITIQIEPFAYGKKCSDAPYKLTGAYFKNKNALIEVLNKDETSEAKELR